MKKTIPIQHQPNNMGVNGAVAGTQHPNDGLEFMGMPQGMTLFTMPAVPEDADKNVLRSVHAILSQLFEQIKGWKYTLDANDAPRISLNGVPVAVLKVLGEVLGNGEVSAELVLKTGNRARIQESVFTGIWQVFEVDEEGAPISTWLEAAPFPQTILAQVKNEAAATLNIPDPSHWPDGAMNIKALFAEIAARLETFKPEQLSHVINLTLMPLTPADQQLLVHTLGAGNISITTHSFGSCSVSSTAVEHVWRVEYFNHKEELILSTIEIVGLPTAILAAQEDIEDTQRRLAELLDWLHQSALEEESA